MAGQAAAVQNLAGIPFALLIRKRQGTVAFEKEIQKLTDQYILKIDQQLTTKEKEIMTV